MNRRTKVAVAAGALVVATGATAGVAVASSNGDDGDSSPGITGDALQKASEVALAETGGGTVTDTELGDEEGYYEVEVTMDDGTQVDVHLNRDFTVIDAGSDKGGDSK